MNGVRHVLLLAAMMLVAARAWSGFPSVQTPDGEITVDRTFETVLVIAQGGWEHIVIQPVYSATRLATPVSPPQIGWVIPLPSAPDSYSSVSDSAFVEAWNILSSISAYPSPGASAGPIPIEERAAYPPAHVPFAPGVGSCEVSVLPAPGGSASLERWCREHDFGSLPEQVARRYAEDGWRFVAVLVRPDQDDVLPAQGRLRPVRLSFRTDSVVYPLRLNADDGPFHSLVLVVSDQRINVTDARPFGIVPVESGRVLRALDGVLWEASVPESSRALIQYEFGGQLSGEHMAHLDIMLPVRAPAYEDWGRSVGDLTVTWRVPIVNRITSFADSVHAPESTLQGILTSAFAHNSGDAPAPLVRLYRTVVGERGGVPLDSLFVSAFCAPALNVLGTRTDLSTWTSDPRIRFRTLLTPLLPVAPPTVPPMPDSSYRSPRRALVPTPERVKDAIRGLFAANTTEELQRRSREIIVQTQHTPRVRFMRELEATGDVRDLTERYAPNIAMLWPKKDGSIGDRRNVGTFERSFRRIGAPLQALWVVAHHTPGAPNPLVLIVRVTVEASGEAEVVSVIGNLPDGLPTELAYHIVEVGLQLPASGCRGTYDYAVTIGE